MKFLILFLTLNINFIFSKEVIGNNSRYNLEEDEFDLKKDFKEKFIVGLNGFNSSISFGFFYSKYIFLVSD